jgi:hypothetical protein
MQCLLFPILTYQVALGRVFGNEPHLHPLLESEAYFPQRGQTVPGVVSIFQAAYNRLSGPDKIGQLRLTQTGMHAKSLNLTGNAQILTLLGYRHQPLPPSPNIPTVKNLHGSGFVRLV